MNILLNPNIRFHYAGLFQNEGAWIHPDRTEETYEIIYVIRGKVYLTEESREFCIGEGQVLLLLPGIRHFGSRISSDVSFYWLHFSVEQGELPFRQRFFENFEHAALFKELLHCHNLPDVPDYLVNAVLLHLLSELCRLSEESDAPPNAVAEKIYEWIRINADAELTVAKAAERFGYSPDHLSRICKQNFGLGASALINRFLCEKAKTLLCNTEKYVKEIAADLKFSTDKAFIAYFKYHESCFPSEFRNRFGKLHMNKQ